MRPDLSFKVAIQHQAGVGLEKLSGWGGGGLAEPAIPQNSEEWTSYP